MLLLIFQIKKKNKAQKKINKEYYTGDPAKLLYQSPGIKKIVIFNKSCENANH